MSEEYDLDDFDLDDVINEVTRDAPIKKSLRSILDDQVMDAEDLRRTDPLSALESFYQIVHTIEAEPTDELDDIWMVVLSNIVKLASSNQVLNIQHLTTVVDFIQAKFDSGSVPDRFGNLVWDALGCLLSDEAYTHLFMSLIQKCNGFVLEDAQLRKGPLWMASVGQSINFALKGLLENTDDLQLRFTLLQDTLKMAQAVAVMDRGSRFQLRAADSFGLSCIISLQLFGHDRGHLLRWKSHLEMTLKDISMEGSLYCVKEDRLMEAQGWCSKILLGVFWLLNGLDSIESGQNFRSYAFCVRSLSYLTANSSHSLHGFTSIATSILLVLITYLRLQLPTIKTSCPFKSIDSTTLSSLRENALGKVVDCCIRVNRAITERDLKTLIGSGLVAELSRYKFHSKHAIWLINYCAGIGSNIIAADKDGTFRFAFDDYDWFNEFQARWLTDMLNALEAQLVHGKIVVDVVELEQKFMQEVKFHDQGNLNRKNVNLTQSIRFLLEQNICTGYLQNSNFIMTGLNTNLPQKQMNEIKLSMCDGVRTKTIGMELEGWTESIERHLLSL